MQYSQDLMQRHLVDIYPYNEAQLDGKFARENNYERLMSEGSPNQRHRAQDEEEDAGDRQNPGEEGEKADGCFPLLLTLIGDCCIPFKLACPCIFCKCCMCEQYPLFEQKTGSLGLLQEWGEFKGYLEPGLNVLNPVSQSALEVNLQTQITEYRQEGMSKDNVHLRLAVSIIYRVSDSFKFTYRLAFPPQNCISEMAAANLRSILGRHWLQEIIQKQSLMSQELKSELNSQLSYWGLYVEACLLKELSLDEEVSLLFQSVILKKKYMEAMLIDFRADVETGRLMKEISQIIDNKASFQIRYLKTVENIINNGSQHTVILNTYLKI